MLTIRPLRWRSLWWFAALAVALAGCAAGGGKPEAGAPAAGAPGACVLVDTDAATDDFRAIAALVRNVRVVGVVATEGVTLPLRGAMAVAHLLAPANLPTLVPVVVGLQSGAPSNESWLPEARASAERLNGFLAEAVPFAEGSRPLEEEVERLMRDCGEVRAVVIGPWSSFVRYRARLGAKLRQVVAQGLPLEDVPAGRSPGFNCRYDLPACRQAHELLRPGGLGVWVDVPRNVTPPYAPTADMLDALRPVGLPGTLRTLMLANPGGWKDMLLTDDVAALYLLHPEAFAPKGVHLEPRVPPDELRRLWVRAVNRAS